MKVRERATLPALGLVIDACESRSCERPFIRNAASWEVRSKAELPGPFSGIFAQPCVKRAREGSLERERGKGGGRKDMKVDMRKERKSYK